MTVLYISHMNLHTDELGRYVTTLTQEVMVKVNQAEETMFLDTLRLIDDTEGCIEYNNDDWTEIDVSGYAVNKAIQCVNGLTGHTLIAPVTNISDNEIYRVEIEY